MEMHFWQAPIEFALMRARASVRKLIVCTAPLTLVACYTGGGWIEVPTYQHYYFYEPHVAAASAAGINAIQQGQTIDLTFEGSKNILSITTMPSRGDQGVVLGSSGKASDYTGIVSIDAVARNRSIPMRLWVAASCRAEDWVIHPNEVRIVDPTGNSSEIPRTVYLRPIPAALHPDSQVFTGHWQYASLDSNEEIRCQKGGTAAFTVGFDMTLALRSLKIVLGDSMQREGDALQMPDVDLSLTAGEKSQPAKHINILQIILMALARI